MNTVREALVRVMPPDTEAMRDERLVANDEVSA